MGKHTFQLAGREWHNVTWWTRSNMRTLYFTLWAAMLTSATNGYDGSLMNGLEAMPAWNNGMPPRLLSCWPMRRGDEQQTC